MDLNTARCGCGAIVRLPSLKARAYAVKCERCLGRQRVSVPGAAFDRQLKAHAQGSAGPGRSEGACYERIEPWRLAPLSKWTPSADSCGGKHALELASGKCALCGAVVSERKLHWEQDCSGGFVSESFGFELSVGKHGGQWTMVIVGKAAFRGPPGMSDDESFAWLDDVAYRRTKHLRAASYGQPV